MATPAAAFASWPSAAGAWPRQPPAAAPELSAGGYILARPGLPQDRGSLCGQRVTKPFLQRPVVAAVAFALALGAAARPRRRREAARRGARAKLLAAAGSTSAAPQLSRCYLHLLGAPEAALLQALRERVPRILELTGCSSIWGVELAQECEASDIVLLKFLRAASLDVAKAAARLEATLRFRMDEGVDKLREQPLAVHYQGHDFVAGRDAAGRPVMISRYGQMDNDKVFGNTKTFLSYRMRVMEEAIAQISFKRGDPEDLCQVHDYSGVSLLFKTKEVTNCVNTMAKVFGEHYPEMKGQTIFVNFPSTFSQLFRAFSVFLPARTRDKFLIFGESDQALLFKLLRPEAVPEALGGMLRAPDDEPGGPCAQVEVSARDAKEVVVADVVGPAELAWDLRVCAGEVSYELFFVPAAGGKKRTLATSGSSQLRSQDGVLSGRFAASEPGVLKCRFSNDRSWFSSRLCLCRATVL